MSENYNVTHYGAFSFFFSFGVFFQLDLRSKAHDTNYHGSSNQSFECERNFFFTGLKRVHIRVEKLAAKYTEIFASNGA